MAKKKRDHQEATSNAAESTFVALTSAVDSTLASLFASSSGPSFIPISKSVRSSVSLVTDTGELGRVPQEQKHRSPHSANETGGGSDEREQVAIADLQKGERPRKRRRVADGDDLESSYLERLAREEERDEKKRRESDPSRRAPPVLDSESRRIVESDDEVYIASDGSLRDSSEETQTRPQHESLTGQQPSTSSDAYNRTVFLGNVSTEAIKSKTSRKVLLKHLADALQDLSEDQPTPKVESLRFRSTAFVSSAGPKKAAFAKKELMDETTKSSNAYVVYSTAVAAEKSAARLNGSVVLDRHLRADLLARPASVDHKRCIFVGNLSFVDEETADLEADGAQTKPRRAKAKEPADAEEGLWQTFGKAGRVESVRVVRDKETRVGKGFAYVQFVNENAVEAALLMSGKKFPPLLPRKLRVMRAKRVKKASSSTSRGVERTTTREQSQHQARPRARIDRSLPPSKKLNTKPKSLVFEGHRASSGGPGKKQRVKQKKKHGSKPTSRSSRRGAAFKAAGGRQKTRP